MTAHAQAQAYDTITAGRPARRADAGTVGLGQRDIDGLLLCGEQARVAVRELPAAAFAPEPAS